ncbi:MaoC/PaaZ C-terminal domain-containing protein [Saccharopolyspora griseoalba]|uniref:MaoC/PaaZ C-terminal domain-containing protein n=1 Tax=Saccharopolyspora griseoalba TaxID=1431848 RepID=A0ABW2LJ79_9PSEU
MPELTTAPKLGPLYLKAAATGPTRRGEALPDTEYVRRGITIDRAELAEYNRACGFGLRDELPITYPHVLSFPLSVQLMTDADFPFALVGLVHVSNRIRQHRPVLVTDELTQRVRVADLRPHPKGSQFDVVTETSVGDQVIWEEVSTYLRRGKSNPDAPQAERREIEPGSPSGTWKVPGDIGRAYAQVSGDHNPIHLHPLTAKALGFPRAIAHGMWSKARCLAALEGRLPEACTVEVDFAKPLLLPSKVDFTMRRNGAGWDFALHSRSGKPHLTGTAG